jgi:glycerol uptake facilitator protein
MVVGELFGGTVHWGQLPIYLIAEVAGAVAAGVLYTVLNTRRSAATVIEGSAEPVASVEGALS